MRSFVRCPWFWLGFFLAPMAEVEEEEEEEATDQEDFQGKGGKEPSNEAHDHIYDCTCSTKFSIGFQK